MLPHSPFHERAVGQADAVLPQDVGHGQRDAHVSGNISQPLVKLFELLDRQTGRGQEERLFRRYDRDLLHHREELVPSSGQQDHSI